MATSLRDRLTELSAAAEPGSPPPDLWRRGRRRQAAARIGTTVLVVVLVGLVGLTGWAWQDNRDNGPADVQGAPQLPDRIFEPSPWLPAFNGPPGALVAIMQAQRKSLTRTAEGVVGITASSSRYGFLQLPHLAELPGDNAVVAPDGRHVAYWVAGRAQASPNTQIAGATVTGVAIYDTVTGRAQTSSIPTRHGLAPGGLLWTGDDTLVFAAGQTRAGDGNSLRSGSSTTDAPPQVWRVDSPGPTRLRISGHAGRGLFFGTNNSDRLVLTDQDRRARMVALGHPATGMRSGGVPVVAVSPGLRRVAAIRGDSSPTVIRIARLRVAPDGRISALGSGTPTRSSRYSGILTWLDDDHVVAVRLNRFRPSVTTRVTSAIVEIDARSGRTRTLIDPVPFRDVDFAGDLLSAHVVHAEPPPRPWGPRVELSMILPVAAVLGILLWSYRVRPR